MKPEEIAGRGSLLTGLLISLFLTALAFALVAAPVTERRITIDAILFLAAVQALVHLRFFLHLDFSARWKWLFLAFAAFVISLFVGGTLWIMIQLDYRMH